AMAAGRILSAERVLEPSLHKATPKGKGRVWPDNRPPPMPMFSSNDVSRWATTRALVDNGEFVIGRRDRETVIISAVTPLGAWHGIDTAVLAQAGFVARTSKKPNTGIIFEPGWESVDKVLHPAKLEFYSSKPPLLSVLIAGLYWLLQMLTGWTLATHPFA